MEDDIAAMAWIEQQVLGLAARQGSLRSSARRMEKEYRLTLGFLGTGLFWQTRVLALMYTLILHPREHWRMEQGDLIYTEIAKRWSLEGVDVITGDEKYGNTVYGFIHRLRNAIAHAHITFLEDGIEFSDGREGQDFYRARLSRIQTEKFLEVVGSVMANRRNWPRH